MPQDDTPAQHPTTRPARPQYGQYDDVHRDGRVPEEEIARMREREERRRRLEDEERQLRDARSSGADSEESAARQAWAGRPEDGAGGRTNEPLRYRPPHERDGSSGTGWARDRIPGHGAPNPAEDSRRTRRLAVWAAVLGILGLVLSIFTMPVVLGIAGVVCGIVALVRSRRARIGRGPAVVGIVTGLLSVVVAVIMVFTAWSMLVDRCGSPLDQDQASWQQCGYGVIDDLQQGR